MGGALTHSKPLPGLESQLMADRPITFKPLQINGALGHSYEPSPKAQHETPVGTNTGLKRTIDAARDIRATELLATGPVCPSCARHDNVGQICRICHKLQVEKPSSPTKTKVGDDFHEIASNDAIVHLILDAEALKRRHTSTTQHELYDMAQRKRRLALEESSDVGSKPGSEARRAALAALTKARAELEKLYEDDDKSELDCTNVLQKGSLLPAIQLTMKCRSGDSMTLAWEVDPSSKTALKAIRALNPTPVTYNLEFRHVNSGSQSKQDRDDGPEAQSKKISWSRCMHQLPQTEYTITGLACITKYEFRCRRVGWGPWSSVSSFSTSAGVSSAPRSLLASEVSPNSVMLCWKAPLKDNGSRVVSFVVRVRAESSSSKFQCSHSTQERFALISNLPSNTVLVFEVAACNSVGESPVVVIGVRTLAEGGKAQTPWEIDFDPVSGKKMFRHIKLGIESDHLPPGSLLDDNASFRNKQSHFRSILKKKMTEYTGSEEIMKLQLSRSSLLTQGLEQLMSFTLEELFSLPIRVKYQDEEGIDAGGLAKDWFSSVSQEAVKRCLLSLDDESEELYIDMAAKLVYTEDEIKTLFEGFGVLLAKALIDGQTLGLRLSTILIGQLVGRTCSYEEIDAAFPSYAKGLSWIASNEVDDAELTFSVSVKLLEVMHVEVLVPNGDEMAVTEENKALYAATLRSWLSHDRYEPALGYCMKGFQRVLPNCLFEEFSLPEIQLLLCGQPSVDIEELSKYCTFGGLHSESPIVQWLWNVLRAFTTTEMQQFLSFVTGCKNVPITGLSPPLLLTAMYVEGDNVDGALPKAHTCFNQLVLPNYSSEAVVEERLRFALANTSAEFSLS